MNEDIKGALYGLENNIHLLHTALEKKFNEDASNIEHLTNQVVYLESRSSKQEKLLLQLADLIIKELG